MMVEAEKTIVYKLIAKLNGLYDLGLDSEPVIDRLVDSTTKKLKFLVIGGSHALREGKCLSERGYDVITCAVGGWRANKTAVEDMTEKVKEALQEIAEDNIIVVHCFDNIALMSRSEEVVICPSGDSLTVSTMWRATSSWPARSVSTCISRTVSRSSGSWKGGR
jgi:hypothetical protein